MTTIETTCGRCGPVETTPRRVALRLGGTAASYRFRCPVCHRTVRRTADDAAVLLLVRAGVRPRGLARLRWGRPAPAGTPDGTPTGTATFASAAGRPRVNSVLRRGRVEAGSAPAAVVPVARSAAAPGPITLDELVEFALRLGVEPTPAAAAIAELGTPVTAALAGHRAG